MADTLIVSFGYRARAGKDHCVQHLINTYGHTYDIRRYAFADPLKVELFDSIMDGPSDAYWERRGLDKYRALPGSLTEAYHTAWCMSWEDKITTVNAYKGVLAEHLQFYGTEYRRAQDPFYWVRKLNKKIKDDAPQIALISDMRFLNEFYLTKALRGYTVKVVRLRADGTQFLDSTRSTAHSSETELEGEKFDFEVQAHDGDLRQLEKDAEEVFELIKQQETPEVMGLGWDAN